jgi:hypothetical protein
MPRSMYTKIRTWPKGPAPVVFRTQTPCLKADPHLNNRFRVDPHPSIHNPHNSFMADPHLSMLRDPSPLCLR